MLQQDERIGDRASFARGDQLRLHAQTFRPGAPVFSDEKALKTLHIIRESDVWHPAMTELAPKVGGLVEFYRSPARKLWSPTGVNVPDYPRMAQVWWQNVSKAISVEATPQQAMDGLARDMDPKPDHGQSIPRFQPTRIASV